MSENTGSTRQEKLSEFATVDHDREARQGFPEVIFAERKTPDQVRAIAASIYERSKRLLATRASSEQFIAVQDVLPQAHYNHLGKTILIAPHPEDVHPQMRTSRVALVTAGTSDLSVAEEAASTLSVAGVEHVTRITDVGVAGIHRLMERADELKNQDVVIVCAGMEGALPSVVGGLVAAPVIAVPTSVGYGASFQGLAALLGMLNSCASGLTVVNIDNGFGAAMAAVRILHTRSNV